MRLTIFALVMFFGASVFSGIAFAGQEEYRQCGDSAPCEIGEFLFDDSYTPIATASCGLTVRNPAGNVHLNNVSMTATSDGWYSYDVTTSGEDYGLYRSQLCCTHETEYLCMDKTFVIATPSSGLTTDQVADAVWDATRSAHNNTDSFGENLQNPSSVSASDIWDYPTRSLTSFGTLTADIWSYSSRSLNTITSLISSIWSNDDRTLTDATLDDGDLAKKNQVETNTTAVNDLKNKIDNVNTTVNTINSEVSGDINDKLTDLSQEVNANRYFLEQLVNTPIIETFIEEGEDPPVSLQSKIKETREIAQYLSSDVSGLQEQIIALNTNWDNTTYQLALNQMTNASRVLGANTVEPNETNSINTRISWLDKKWKSPIVSNLSTQTTSALANVSSISREVKSYGKTFISKQYLDIAGEHINKLKLVIGEENDDSTTTTLFGYIADLERINDILVRQSLDLDQILLSWNQYTESEIDIKLARIKRTILEVNKISDADSLLGAKVGDKKHRENLALSLQGIISSNLIFLAQDSEQVMQNIWLEHGSIIFRSLVTNPSDTIAQEVEIKYYLPQEIDPEHIIKIEDGLETQFDVEKDSLFVSGQILLNPGETKTFVVEVTDVWKISPEEITSIRKQTDTLFESLRNTSYFAQGATIKADIEVNLDKILLLLENNQTPELKIRSHREARLELESAKSKLVTLKTIVSSAGSVGTVFGFVGGVQTVAVWGLIIILITGFVFLSIYLKMLVNSTRDDSNKTENLKGVKKLSKIIKTNKEDDSAKILTKLGKKSKNLSTFSLLKEIIIMRLQPTDKSSGRKRFFMIAIFLSLSVLIFVSIILSSINRSSLTNPLPNSPEGRRYQGNLFQNESDKAIAVNQKDNRNKKGLVMGVHASGENSGINDPLAPKDTVISEENILQKERVVRATIPSEYKAINVRTEPSSDAKIAGRLYTNQNVSVLYQIADWLLIETKVIDKTAVIKGWILESFTSEIIE